MTTPSAPSTARKLLTRRRRTAAVATGTLVIALVAAACTSSPGTARAAHPRSGPATTVSTSTTIDVAPPTTTTQPAPAAVTEGPVTAPPLPVPGPGFVAGHVTAVGDSVMIDYQDPLQQDVPGIDVEAAVSRQWTDGETVLRQLQTAGQLGAVVVVGLGTNGPVTTTQFNSMMTLLSGASRVVFVNIRVDRTWQTSNNAVLAAGVARYRRAALADWHSLATVHPTWLYSTQTHLPIGGAGAQALAAMVAGQV